KIAGYGTTRAIVTTTRGAPESARLDGVTHDRSHRAPRKPLPEAADDVRRAVQADRAVGQRRPQRDAPQPDTIERPDVRPHLKIDVEFRVLQAHRHVGPLEHQPVGADVAAAKLELDHGAAGGQPLTIDAALHPPEQYDGIQLGRARIAERPARAPAAE